MSIDPFISPHPDAQRTVRDSETKVFCFFFSKKKSFLFEPWRCFLPTTSFLFFSIISTLYVYARPVYMWVLTLLMAGPYRTPFLDFDGMFSVVSCWQRGIDVYVTNPCDPLGRPMNYAPLWLRLRFLDVGPHWAMLGGICFALLLCLTFYALPPTPRWRDRVVLCLAAVSSTTFFAVERGNMDILVYFCAFLAALCLTRSFLLRQVGYALLLLAALLKFYPLAAAIAAVRERLAVATVIMLGMAALVSGFFLGWKTEILKAIHNIPHGSAFGDSFGSVQLPGGLVVALQTILRRVAGPEQAASLDGYPMLPLSAWLFLLLCAALVIHAIIFSRARRRLVATMPAPYNALFLIGSALLIGCFFVGQSIDYRGIFFLLVLPGLLCLDGPSTPRHLRIPVRFTIIAVMIVMYRLVVYGVYLRRHLYPGNSVSAALLWLGYEALWWWIMAVLAGVCGCLIGEAPALKEASSFLKKRTKRLLYS